MWFPCCRVGVGEPRLAALLSARLAGVQAHGEGNLEGHKKGADVLQALLVACSS